VVVAFSGGVDSTFLLKVAKEILDRKVIAVTVVSPLQSKNEIDDAGKIARRLGVKHLTIHANTLRDKHVIGNSRKRCYYCKRILLGKIRQIARRHGYVAIEATNRSDLRDHRPGIRALKQMGFESPLIESGFEKDDIRTAAHHLGLPNWDKPNTACLASRIPYDQEITRQRLQRIDKAENYLRRFKLKQVRVRDYFPMARIEVETVEFKKIITKHKTVVRYFRRLGYRYVMLDLNGYRTGSMDL
jgi:uncharacterized protein